MAYFTVAGEGVLDLAVGRKLLIHLNHEVIAQFDKGGKHKVDANLNGYFNASRHSPWLVLRDLDDADCPLALVDAIAPQRAAYPNLMLRVCVRSIEAWLIADSTGFSQFFGIALANIPNDPETLLNPKSALLAAVQRARHRNLREGMLPRVGSGRKVGPEYNAVLSDFVENVWNIDRACTASDSLNRAALRIQSM